MLFSIMGALSEFERDLIVERTVAGIQAAKARGVTVGRPRSMSHEQVQHAKSPKLAKKKKPPKRA